MVWRKVFDILYEFDKLTLNSALLISWNVGEEQESSSPNIGKGLSKAARRMYRSLVNSDRTSEVLVAVVVWATVNGSEHSADDVRVVTGCVTQHPFIFQEMIRDKGRIFIACFNGRKQDVSTLPCVCIIPSQRTLSEIVPARTLSRSILFAIRHTQRRRVENGPRVSVPTSLFVTFGTNMISHLNIK